MLTCSQCGTPYKFGDTVCSKCGRVLLDTRSSTIALQVDPTLLRLRRDHVKTGGALHPEKSVTLLIRGMAERFIFEDGTEVILGRTDLMVAEPGHFDMTPYGGHDRGVSRNHALLRFSDDAITITDLSSSNGTFINTQRLPPTTPQQIKHGDEIMLGSLSMIIKFE